MKFNQTIYKKLLSLGLASSLALAGGGTIAYYEGKSNTAYLDPVNIYTICYGETKGVKKGDYKTDDQCLESLAADLVEHDKGMMKAISVPLTDYQHAAFLSFCYNVGVKACTTSTAFKLLNQKKYKEACNQLLRWVYADGKVLPGLVKRREDERKICLGEVKIENL